MARAGNQASRWMLILDRLSASKTGATINELAEEFACTRRTIYRDLEHLQSWLRVPLVREGEEDDAHGSTRWRLMEGAKFRPAVEFSPSEMLSLFAASRILEPLRDTPYGAGLASLQAKLRGRLSPETLKQVEQDGAALAAGPKAHRDYQKHAGTIETLTRAIRDHRTVEMSYHSLSSGKTSTRKLDPYRLWFAEGTLYAVGGCHVHNLETRTFAVDRMRSIALTNERFDVPKNFAWEDYTRDSFRVFRGEPVEVVVDFSPAIAPLIRERPWHASQQLKALPGGGVRLTMRVAGIFEVTQWILGFGSQARVVGPAALVSLLKDELKAMAKAYAKS